MLTWTLFKCYCSMVDNVLLENLHELQLSPFEKGKAKRSTSAGTAPTRRPREPTWQCTKECTKYRSPSSAATAASRQAVPVAWTVTALRTVGNSHTNATLVTLQQTPVSPLRITSRRMAKGCRTLANTAVTWRMIVPTLNVTRLHIQGTDGTSVHCAPLQPTKQRA